MVCYPHPHQGAFFEQVMTTPAYITKEGLERMMKELADLKLKKREVSERINKAKDLGDLSENAEYQDAKEEMAFLSGHMLELEDYINRAVVIEQRGTDKVHVGSTVIVSSANGEKTYTIVGANEANPSAGKISNETPLAQSLLGKRVGDVVAVMTPSGKVDYTIVKIT